MFAYYLLVLTGARDPQPGSYRGAAILRACCNEFVIFEVLKF